MSASGDCDDGWAGAYDGAAESCDNADNDCDSTVDEDATDASSWWADGDGDGYTPAQNDCDDDDAGVNPATTGLDVNCDGIPEVPVP